MKNVVAFIKEAYAELKKVSWPSKEETKRLTGYVIGVSLGVALFVWVLDVLFSKAISLIIIK